MPTLPSLAVEEKNGKRYYVSPNGLYLPSVTTVLSHSKTADIIAWRNRVGAQEADSITRRAGTRGTKFHSLMERYLGNEQNIFSDVMPDMRQAFNDAKSTLDKIDNIHYIEAALYSEVLGIAGRTDVIAEFEGVPSIIDFKTSRREKREEWIDSYFEQATAYSLMYEEMTGTQTHQIVVIISTDGLDKPQVFVKERIHYIDSLMMKIETYRRDNQDVR